MAGYAFIALGSNLDAETNLVRAASELRHLGHVLATSDVYRNPAIGPSPQPDYLNAGILIDTGDDARAMRSALRRLEREMGRVRTSDKYAPRTIDLDLCLLGAQIIEEPGFTLPHPHLTDQAHVAVPIAELLPAFRHPVTGETLGAIAARVRPTAVLVRLPEASGRFRRAAGLMDGEVTGGRLPRG